MPLRPVYVYFCKAFVLNDRKASKSKRFLTTQDIYVKITSYICPALFNIMISATNITLLMKK